MGGEERPEITEVFGLDIEGLNIDNHYCTRHGWHEAGLHRMRTWADMDATMRDLFRMVPQMKDTKRLISHISIGTKAGAAYVIHLLPLSDDLRKRGDVPLISSIKKGREQTRTERIINCQCDLADWFGIGLSSGCVASISCF